VDIFDVRNDERVLVLACDWVIDIYTFVELSEGGMVSERAQQEMKLPRTPC